MVKFKIVKLIGIIAFILMLLSIKTFKSYFICNQNKCTVEDKNLYGMTISSTPVNIQEIDHFDLSITHSYFRLNPFSQNSNKGKTLYTINANMKDGTLIAFFKKPSSKDYYARKVVNELNALIKNKTNLDIKYSYTGK